MTTPSNAESFETADHVFSRIEAFTEQLRRAQDEPTPARAILFALKAAIEFLEAFDDAKRDRLAGPFKLAVTAVVAGDLVQTAFSQLSTVAEQYDTAVAQQRDLVEPIG